MLTSLDQANDVTNSIATAPRLPCTAGVGVQVALPAARLEFPHAEKGSAGRWTGEKITLADARLAYAVCGHVNSMTGGEWENM